MSMAAPTISAASTTPSAIRLATFCSPSRIFVPQTQSIVSTRAVVKSCTGIGTMISSKSQSCCESVTRFRAQLLLNDAFDVRVGERVDIVLEPCKRVEIRLRKQIFVAAEPVAQSHRGEPQQPICRV